MKKSKLFGIFILVPATLLLFETVGFFVFAALFAIEDANIIELMPFLAVTILQLAVLVFLFYFSLKLIREQSLPIKENNISSFALIAVGVVYFAYNLANYLYNNITSFNPGGEAQPILSFLWGIMLVSLGLVLRRK